MHWLFLSATNWRFLSASEWRFLPGVNNADMSQQQMAEMLYINRRTYSSYEIGSRGMPIEILEKIADIFNTSTDYLLGRTEIRYPYPPVLPRNLD